MSDIFDEVEEELRRDRAEVLWKKYWPYIVSVALVVVVGVSGWRYYEYAEARKSAAAGARFEAALQLAKDGKADEADAALIAIAKDAPTGYRMLASFREAAELAGKDKTAAVKAYDAIAADSALPQLYRDLAKVRAGYLLVDNAATPDIVSRLEPLSAFGQPWRNAARELIGLSAYRTGDRALAEKQFTTIQIDADAPEGVRRRADFMLSLLAGLPPKS
jgi:hypothetical protein